jgi:glycosyltransferase involved in cell wall biosynthesis
MMQESLGTTRALNGEEFAVATYEPIDSTIPAPELKRTKMTCRFLYLIGELGPGGSERQLYYLLQAMDRERYRPTVAVWNVHRNNVYGPQIRALGVALHSFPAGLSAATKLRAFRRLVRELKPEVVHSYSFYTNFVAHWGTYGTKAVALGSIRNDFTSEKKYAGLWRGRLSARWPRHQISNNSLAIDVVRRSRGLFVPEQIHLVRNALDLELFRSVPFTTGSQVRLVGVGSLVARKRWDRLLLAALELKRRGLNFLVRIAGDGPLRGSLWQQAQGLGLADRLQFIGYTPDIPKLLSHATFLVHTADHEGCPNVVMEAMACRRAVVATDVGDVPSLVEDGKTGFVVRRGDDTTLAARMATFITQSDLCRQMGEAGRVKAEREFGLDRLVAGTLAAYRASGWQET